MFFSFPYWTRWKFAGSFENEGVAIAACLARWSMQSPALGSIQLGVTENKAPLCTVIFLFEMESGIYKHG